MFPEEFTKRLRSQHYLNDDLLIKSLMEESPVSIRINTSKWKKIPAGSERVPWCENGWYLSKRPSYTLDPLFHAGCYYPQEASGMFTGEAFRQVISAADNIRVLDLCGAPGGKSTLISSMLGKNSFLVANEVIKSRAKILAENITKWGNGNAIVTGSDPRAFSVLGGFFDAILVDAPCSGEGMFRDRTAIDEWSVPNTQLCEERQKRILSDVWPSLKEGGVLIYSTCTFNPGENEKQIKWLLDAREGESLTLDTASWPGIREIDYEGIKGYGFYPGMIKGEGFFISVIRKSGPGEHLNQIKSKVKPDFNRRDDFKKINELTGIVPGTILREGNSVYSLPVTPGEFETLSGFLNIIKKGTELFTEKNRDIIPSNELALSFEFTQLRIQASDVSFRDALRFLSKESFEGSNKSEGWAVVRYDDVNLGLVKNIGSRINNYLPTEWRIRMAHDEDRIKEIIRWD